MVTLRKLKSSLAVIENAPLSLLGFGGSFVSLIILRLMIEGALGSFSQKSFEYLFFEFTHTFLFFLFAFSLFLPLLAYLNRETLLRTANLLLFGFLIILTPPIIDTLILGSGKFWSFYEFDGLHGLFIRYWTFFGDSPSIGITYGVRLEVLIITLLSIGLIWLKTRSYTRGLLGGILIYSLFFVLGTFPSWITLFLSGPTELLQASNLTVAQIFLTPEPILNRNILELRSVLNIKMSLWYALLLIPTLGSLLLYAHKDHWLALYHNARFPQVFYHGGLILLGALLAFHFEDLSLPITHFSYLALFLLVWSGVLAWLASVVINDFYDLAIDQETNPTRPLVTQTISSSAYLSYGVIFFFFSLLLAGLVSSQALILILGYQVCAWVYSAPPFRLKRFPIIATLSASFASILLLAAGYLALSDTHSLKTLPIQIILSLFLVFTLALPIKDFKDIVGDRKDSVYTLPVLFGELWAKRIIGSLIFAIFIFSPLILNTTKLYLPALLFGSAAFWIIQNGTSKKDAFFHYQKFSLFFFLLVFLYGVLAALILF